MIAALFVRPDSVYKTMPGVDPWDIERDARGFDGSCAVVAHPPCRAWGRLKHFAKPRPDEKQLAIFAVEKVRAVGGVLEHPEYSDLWSAAELPRPGEGSDSYGGWTLALDQLWFGHGARKRTWLYIVGVGPADIPRIPLSLNYPTHVIGGSSSHRSRGLRHMKKADREHSPPEFAAWLVDLAKRCQK